MSGEAREAVSKMSREIAAAQVLFFANAAIWLVIGAASLMRQAALSSSQTSILWVIAVLMAGNAAAMAIAGAGLRWRTRLFGIFGLAVLLVNIVLTFTDQFGVFDLATLFIDVVLFGLLVVILVRR